MCCHIHIQFGWIVTENLKRIKRIERHWQIFLGVFQCSWVFSMGIPTPSPGMCSHHLPAGGLDFWDPKLRENRKSWKPRAQNSPAFGTGAGAAALQVLELIPPILSYFWARGGISFAKKIQWWGSWFHQDSQTLEDTVKFLLSQGCYPANLIPHPAELTLKNYLSCTK